MGPEAEVSFLMTLAVSCWRAEEVSAQPQLSGCWRTCWCSVWASQDLASGSSGGPGMLAAVFRQRQGLSRCGGAPNSTSRQVHISSDSAAIVTASWSPPCWLLEAAPLINQCLPVVPRRPPWNPSSRSTCNRFERGIFLNLCLYKNYWEHAYFIHWNGIHIPSCTLTVIRKRAYSYQRGKARKGIH